MWSEKVEPLSKSWRVFVFSLYLTSTIGLMVWSIIFILGGLYKVITLASPSGAVMAIVFALFNYTVYLMDKDVNDENLDRLFGYLDASYTHGYSIEEQLQVIKEDLLEYPENEDDEKE